MRKGWMATTLGDLAQINPESLGIRTPEDYEFGYIDLSMVNEGKITYPNEKIKYKDASPRARRIVKNGDILLSTVRPNLKGFGRVLIDAQKLICSTGFAVLRCDRPETSEYLYQYIFSHFIESQIDALVVGSNYPAINNDDVKDLQIFIPKSIAEQKKIAAILRTWDDAIEKVEKLIAAKENELEWRCAQTILFFKKKLGLKETQIRDFLKKDIVIEKGKPLKGANVSEGSIPVIAGGKTSPYAHNKPTHTKPCITVSASGAYAGYIWYHQAPIWASDCNVIYSLTGSTKYLYYTLKSQQHKVYALQSGGAQPHVYARDIQNLKIVLPDAETQQKIVSLLDAAEREIFLLQKKLKKLQSQKRGLMQKLLTGEWQVKTSENEAA